METTNTTQKPAAKAKEAPLSVFKTELLPINDIFPSPLNGRKGKSENLESLAENIRVQGLLHPITVRPHPSKEGKYEIVTGERRWLACKKFFDLIPGVVRTLTESESHEIRVTENLQREDLTPIEEAENVQTLISLGHTTDTIADRIGRPVDWVVRRAKLTNLSAKWLKALKDEKNIISTFTASHLEAVVRFDHAIQDDLLENGMRECSYSGNGNITVKELLDVCNRTYLLRLSSAPWFRTETSLDSPLIKNPPTPPCESCNLRSSVQINLFPEFQDSPVKNNDRCTDRMCYQKKIVSYIERKVAETIKAYGDVVLIDKEPHKGFLPRTHELKQKAVSHWNVIDAKKGDKGAKMALIIDGPGIGSVVWVKASSSREESKVTGSKQTMAEKHKGLEKRRTVYFYGKVLEKVCALFQAPGLIKENGLNVTDTQELLIRLVTRFGAVSLREKIEQHEYSEPFKATRTGDKLSDLLKCVLPRIREELRRQQGAQWPEKKHAVDACKWFGFDIEKIDKEVLAAVPEPKCWAKIKEADKAKAEKVKAEKKAKASAKKTAKKTEKKKSAANTKADKPAPDKKEPGTETKAPPSAPPEPEKK